MQGVSEFAIAVLSWSVFNIINGAFAIVAMAVVTGNKDISRRATNKNVSRASRSVGGLAGSVLGGPDLCGAGHG